jgi:hypothetical protein
MRSATRALATTLVLLGPWVAASSTAEDRIAASASGSTLTDTDGGAGESIGWLHNFNPDAIITMGAEHQKLGDAQWTFGSLSGSLTRELGDGRYGFYAEGHEGAGDDGPHPFHYHIEAAGVTGTWLHRLTLQFEDRRVDVETTHGNLPKVGLSYLWTQHWLTSVSYANSITGNLGTRLTAVRVDRYNPLVNFLAGAAYGPASPAILNLQNGIVSPGHLLREEYVGASKTFARRTDVTLTADYLDLSGIKRATLTLSCIFRLGSLGAQH